MLTTDECLSMCINKQHLRFFFRFKVFQNEKTSTGPCLPSPKQQLYYRKSQYTEKPWRKRDGVGTNNLSVLHSPPFRIALPKSLKISLSLPIRCFSDFDCFSLLSVLKSLLPYLFYYRYALALFSSGVSNLSAMSIANLYTNDFLISMVNTLPTHTVLCPTNHTCPDQTHYLHLTPNLLFLPFLFPLQ